MTASAGFTCQIFRTGVSVAMTDEPCAAQASGEVKVTNSARRIIDPTVAVTVKDNSVSLADTDVAINFALGYINKTTGAFTGPVTITGAYLSLFAEAEARAFEINCNVDLLEDTVMSSTTAQRERNTLGLFDLSGSVSGIARIDDDLDSGAGTLTLAADWAAGARRVLKVTFPSGAIFCAFVKLESIGQSATFDGLVENTYAWKLDSSTSLDVFSSTSASAPMALATGHINGFFGFIP